MLAPGGLLHPSPALQVLLGQHGCPAPPHALQMLPPPVTARQSRLALALVGGCALTARLPRPTARGCTCRRHSGRRRPCKTSATAPPPAASPATGLAERAARSARRRVARTVRAQAAHARRRASLPGAHARPRRLSTRRRRSDTAAPAGAVVTAAARLPRTAALNGTSSRATEARVARPAFPPVPDEIPLPPPQSTLLRRTGPRTAAQQWFGSGRSLEAAGQASFSEFSSFAISCVGGLRQARACPWEREGANSVRMAVTVVIPRVGERLEKERNRHFLTFGESRNPLMARKAAPIRGGAGYARNQPKVPVRGVLVFTSRVGERRPCEFRASPSQLHAAVKRFRRDNFQRIATWKQ